MGSASQISRLYDFQERTTAVSDQVDAELNQIVDQVNNLVTDTQDGDAALTTHKTATPIDHPDASVTEAKLAANAVTVNKIGTGAVTESKIADGAVTANKVGANAVTEAKIADGSVTVNKIGTGAVTEAKIGTGAVTNTKLGAFSVSNDKIEAGAVTETKIGTGAVTNLKIGNSSVTQQKIADGAVTLSKLDPSLTATVELNQHKSVATLDHPDGSVTNAKLATDVKVGSLAALTTTEKASVVGAINEIDQRLSTPDYSDPTTEYTSIFSLGSDVVSGTMKGTIKGRTYQSILPDTVAGCEATTGWTASNVSVATDSSNKFEGTNCLKITLSASDGYIRRDVLSLLDTSKYYLITAHLKNGNLSGSGIILRVDCTGDAGILFDNYVTGTSYERRGVVLQPSNFDTATNVYIQLRCLGSSTQYGFVDAIMINEISASEYAEGASAMLDKYSFVLGMASTEPQEYVAPGKNLFDGEWIDGKYYDVTTGVLTALSTRTATNKFRVEPNTNYYVKAYSYADAATLYRHFWDINGNFISSTTGLITGYLFTTPSNAHTVAFSVVSNAGDLNSVGAYMQLEKGTAPTNYESYTEIRAYTNITTHGLPNGVSDKIDVLSCKGTINCKEYDLVSGDITALVTSGANVDYVRIAKPLDFIYYNVGSTGTLETFVFEGYNFGSFDSGSWDDISNINKISSKTSTVAFWLIVAKGTYADTAAAQAALAGTKIIYQLANPYTVENALSNPLVVHPNGTVYSKAVKRMMLDGSLSWAYAADYTGYKRVSLALSDFISDSEKIIKYDGKHLVNYTSNGTNWGIDVSRLDSSGFLFVCIADTDSGWGETYTPSQDEIQAYFYGWKMNNGTFGTAYNGSGTKTWTRRSATSNTESLTTVPNYRADGEGQYTLKYDTKPELSSVPVTIHSEPINMAGAVKSQAEHNAAQDAKINDIMLLLDYMVVTNS